MDNRIVEIAKNIKSLKIQGARRIAEAALKALDIQLTCSAAETNNELYSELASVADLIASQRPTEPMLRNTLRSVLASSGQEKEMGLLKKQLRKFVKSYFSEVEKNVSKLAHYGSQAIQDNSTVLVHCHSNTVIKTIKNAHDIGKKIKVICTETRPRQQGHMTAEELADYGIDTTLIVDSAAGYFLKEVDIAIVGADAITAVGDLINKVGTRNIAELCYNRSIPLYCAAELYKYDPVTQWGVIEKIEQRDPKEIVGNKKVRFKVENPAFDFTPAKYITGYITEKGIVSPALLLVAAKTDVIKGGF